MRGLTPEQTLILADAFCAHASGDLSVRDYAALNAIAAVTTAHIHAVVVFPYRPSHGEIRAQLGYSAFTFG